jgi:hypothetical protein
VTPPPGAATPVPSKSSEAEPASEGSDQGSSSGFPGLSEADRALIGEYLRSKRDG